MRAVQRTVFKMPLRTECDEFQMRFQVLLLAVDADADVERADGTIRFTECDF